MKKEKGSKPQKGGGAEKKKPEKPDAGRAAKAEKAEGKGGKAARGKEGGMDDEGNALKAGAGKGTGKAAEAKGGKETAKKIAGEATAGKGGAAAKKEGEKPAEWAKKPKSAETKKLRDRIRKKKLPVFRGRFGKRWLRRKSRAKWDKWRYPRGIDIHRRQEDGALPEAGYRKEKSIRFLHPSGYAEKLVRNPAELKAQKGKDGVAVRFAAGIGRRKRTGMLEEARKLGMVVLNP